MAFRFDRYARGLLSLLDSKGQGRTPQLIEEAIRGGLDLTDFYAAAIREVITGTAGATAGALDKGWNPATNSGTLLVPQDELWLMESFTATGGANLAAGTTYRGLAAAALDVAGLGLFSLADSPTQFTVGERMFYSSHRRVLLLPGMAPGVWCNHFIAGTAQAVTCYAHVARLKI